ncbi:hypothetical protein WJX74_000011 [Apatococcus lobatus]|uniref:Derlin n=2 Tax=Apatococcus TaxID=904362 RepID=A0AAW1SVV2_9CHLO
MAMEDWYKQLPIVTRFYVTASFVITAACSLDVIEPKSIYFNPRLIFQHMELWRLLTNFCFFGALGLDFLFHMFFLIKYSKALEEGSFRGKSADFFWMLLFGAVLLTSIAPFVNIQFLGSSLTFMMVYVWGRRHQYVQLSFLGIFTFTAPYLPWVLLAFSLVLRSSPVVDLLGMVAGHAYYFLEDVYPRMSGRRPLKTPSLVKAMFPRSDDAQPAIVIQDALGAGAAPAAPGAAAGAAADVALRDPGLQPEQHHLQAQQPLQHQQQQPPEPSARDAAHAAAEAAQQRLQPRIPPQSEVQQQPVHGS